jgi:hypothetical protein
VGPIPYVTPEEAKESGIVKTQVYVSAPRDSPANFLLPVTFGGPHHESHQYNIFILLLAPTIARIRDYRDLFIYLLLFFCAVLFYSEILNI